MIHIWINIVFGILIIILLIVIFNNSKKILKIKSEKDSIQLKYKAIYDEICSARDIYTPMRESRDKYFQLSSEHLKIALRIERFLFMERKDISDVFYEYFIFDKPRQIISGDFYWIEKCDSKIFVAFGDCTGHDMASMILKFMAINLLKEEIKRSSTSNDNSATILNRIRERFLERYNLIKNPEAKYLENIDLSLIIIDKNAKSIDFSGGNNSIIHIANNTLNEYKGSKIPIGDHYGNKTVDKFNNINFKFNIGDILYLFSDGYIDQFGGMHERRFMLKNFRKLLLEVSDNEMGIQKEKIQECFEQWRGIKEQVDDILVVGIKLNNER